MENFDKKYIMVDFVFTLHISTKNPLQKVEIELFEGFISLGYVNILYSVAACQRPTQSTIPTSLPRARDWQNTKKMFLQHVRNNSLKPAHSVKLFVSFQWQLFFLAARLSKFLIVYVFGMIVPTLTN